jgi:effector-binding domain-containing protein
MLVLDEEREMRSRRPLTPVALWLTAILLGPAQAVAQTPVPPPAAQPPASQPAPSPPAPQSPAAKPSDPFGEETTLVARPVVMMKGEANWDSAYETLIDAFKSLYAVMEKQGLKAAGSAMTIYTSTDDTGFQYQAAVPIEAAPANPPKGDIEIGQSPAGKVIKFVHRGSYDSMDTTYEAITNYLDTKQLEAQDLFIEEYVTDPLKTPENQLVVNVFVPIK